MTEKTPSGFDPLSALRIEREESASGRPGRWLFVILAVAVVALGAGAWWWLGGRAVAAVRTADVLERSGGTTTTVLNASGYVTARRRATVSSKITGKVVAVLVEEGMAVREGQVLARLDDAAARKALALYEAQLDAARGALSEDEVRLHLAELTLARNRDLVAKGVAGQADLDAAQAERDALVARLSLARDQVGVAERQVALGRQDLDDTVIRSPFDGVAVSKDAQPGEMVSPISAGGGFTRTGICTVVDMKSLEVEVDVNESYIHRVHPGQRVETVLDAYPDWNIPGSVITTVPTADRQKATVKVRIAFDRLDPRILPDMGAKVAFLSEAGTDAPATGKLLEIPKSALRRDGGRDVVFVLRDGKVERRAVKVASTETDKAQIVAGLNAGDRVVVDGPPDLADGQRVEVR